MPTPEENVDSGIDNIWQSDYVQKNPNKAYKTSYGTEYSAVAAYLNGGPRSDPASFSKMGKGLVAMEDARRQLAVVTPEPEPEPQPGEPAPIAGQGYRLVFEDNFDTLRPGCLVARDVVRVTRTGQRDVRGERHPQRLVAPRYRVSGKQLLLFHRSRKLAFVHSRILRSQDALDAYQPGVACVLALLDSLARDRGLLDAQDQ